MSDCNALTGAFLDVVVEYDGELHEVPYTTGELDVDYEEQTLLLEMVVGEGLDALKAANFLDEDGRVGSEGWKNQFHYGIPPRYDRLLIRIYDRAGEDAEVVQTLEMRDVVTEPLPFKFSMDDVLIFAAECTATGGMQFVDEDADDIEEILEGRDRPGSDEEA